MNKSLPWIMLAVAFLAMVFAAPVWADDPPPPVGEEPSTDDIHHSAPPFFTALPYADEYVITGSEGGAVGASEHYFPSNGDGTFDTRSDIPGLLTVDGVDVADMDGDGDNDFIACDGSTNEVYLYTNDGVGNFSTSILAMNIGSRGFCTYLRVGDFNEDSVNDFVVGDNGVSNGMFVYLQTAPGVFTRVTPGLDIASWNTVGGNSLFGIATGDVDGDGHQDILVLGYTGRGRGQMRFYKGDGTGAMAPSTLLFNIGTDFGVLGTVGLALFDLEGDGDLDIIAGGGSGGGIGGSGTHFIYTNNGNGTFTKPSGFDFDLDAQTGIDAYDFDGDKDDDLAVVTFFQSGVPDPSRLYFVENQGGSLASPVFVDSLGGPSIGIGAPQLDKVINVAIDIKPGSDPNSINCNNENGIIAVAILTTEAFDVGTVDHTTVTFEGASEVHRSKKTEVARRHEEDVDGDGDTDLVFHFRLGETDLTCSSTNGHLRGQTFDGDQFAGVDAVRMIGKFISPTPTPTPPPYPYPPPYYAALPNAPDVLQTASMMGILALGLSIGFLLTGRHSFKIKS